MENAGMDRLLREAWLGHWRSGTGGTGALARLSGSQLFLMTAPLGAVLVIAQKANRSYRFNEAVLDRVLLHHGKGNRQEFR
jgi:hypothetical protein